MTAMDIINRLDLMEPNDYSPEQKLKWLSSLDGKIFNDVILTHELPEGSEALKPPVYVNGNEELIIPEPHGTDVYYYYLQSMISSENNETQRFSNRRMLYNNAYQEWVNFYNRTHMPRQACGGNRFKF